MTPTPAHRSRRTRGLLAAVVLLAVIIFGCAAAWSIGLSTFNCCAQPTPTVPPQGALSPEDTRQIAFMSNRDGNWELYQLTLGTGQQVNLTQNPADDGFVSYSADGGGITFISTRDRATDNGDLTPYQMNADGTNQHRVANDLPTIANLVTTGRFNWDENLAVDGTGALVSLRDLNLEVYGSSSGPDGAPVQTNLSRSGAIDWFPSVDAAGQRITFGSDREGQHDLYVINADGSGLRRLTDSPADELSGVWASDNRHIVLYSEQSQLDGGRLALFVIDADGDAPVMTPLDGALTGSDGQPLTADLQAAQDGVGVIFMGYDGSDWEIYYAAGPDQPPVNLTDNAADDIFATWR